MRMAHHVSRLVTQSPNVPNTGRGSTDEMLDEADEEEVEEGTEEKGGEEGTEVGSGDGYRGEEERENDGKEEATVAGEL
ncbi:hypothetical protein L1049_006398 [Liquidambar formosana]|uniref:Uncharacterized protein n=1 Tax=Liquidambar formosana TaxID=63359 RepID=A0AAP0RFG4_LIQFO